MGLNGQKEKKSKPELIFFQSLFDLEKIKYRYIWSVRYREYKDTMHITEGLNWGAGISVKVSAVFRLSVSILPFPQQSVKILANSQPSSRPL